MGQSREEMRKRIEEASDRKILRRQMEQLAEYSRVNDYAHRAPEASNAMVSVHKELIKAECIFFVRILIMLFTICHIVKCFPIKEIKFIRSE